MIVRRLRWMALGAGVSYLGKRQAGRSVNRATEKIEERLPAPVARVAGALPANVVRSAGAVAAAGGAARTAAGATGTAVSAAGSVLSASRSASLVIRRVTTAAVETRRTFSQRIGDASDELRQQTELERRRLKSDYVRYAEGDGPAIEALLDRRDEPPDDLPETPVPIRPGRRRFRPGLPQAPVGRVQRTYRPPTKPWDRR